MAGTLSEIKDVVSLASSVLKLGEGWYRASSALEEFKSKVARLERKYESWQKRARKAGLSSESTLRSSLQEAEEQLRREEARLKSLDCGCGCLCLYMSCGTDFPAQLGKSIVDLDNVISSNWRADDDAGAEAQKRAEFLAREPKFGFERDSRYVRIPVIEEILKHFLNSEGSGDEAVRVALLYGRAGSGKSSMARNLVLDYKKAATSHANGSASCTSHGCRQFDDVLYVECGPKADPRAKQAELFRMVNWENISGAEKETQKDPDTVRAMLGQLLKERRSLIILDDVWEEEFLKDMVGICGEDMRILVTSQKRNLCEDSLIEPAKSVSMDKITHEDSLKILKVHTGFCANDDVPESVEECMNILVEKVDGHPHALASVAVAIDKNHKSELRQWEDAICELDQLLNISLSTQTKNPLHDVIYERSCTEAIQMKFSRLGGEEKMLLVLMVMLEGRSIAEEILRLFYGEITTLDSAKGVRSSRHFSDARKHLENFQCIKTDELDDFQYIPSGEYVCKDTDEFQIILPTGKPARGLYWSIHFLDRQFIKSRMEDNIHRVLETVKCLPNKIQGLEAEPQVHVTKLMSIFFEYKWSKKIGAFEEKFLDISRLTRWEMLPVIRLMAKNVGKGWDMTLQKSADQIFVSFTRDWVIHKDAAKNLLRSSVSKDQIWNRIVVLGHAHYSGKVFNPDEIRVEGGLHWHYKRTWSIDEDLVQIILGMFGHLELSVNNSDFAPLNFEQCKALVVILQTRFKDARSCIFRMRKLVLGLFEMVTSPCCPENIRDPVVVVLSYLIPLMQDRPFEYGREGSAITPIIIERLVTSFQGDCDGSVHERVEQASVDRSVDESVAQTAAVRSVDGVAQALVELARDSKSDIQQQMVNIGFHRLVHNLGGGKSANGRSQVHALETLISLSVDQLETGLDATQIQDLSNCLAELIEHPEKEKVSLQLHPGIAIQVWSLYEVAFQPWSTNDSTVQLLMRIDPARGSGMILHSSYEFGARGAELVRVGQYRDGLSDLNKAQRLNPQGFTYVDDQIRARQALEDWEGALKDCDYEERHAGAAKSSHEWSEFYGRRSTVKWSMGNLPGALEDLDESLHSDPNNFVALMQRGRVKFLMGDEEGARAAAGEKAKGEGFWFGTRGGASFYWNFPKWTDIKLRALLKRNLGDLPGALEDLNKCLQLFPYEYEVLVHRGYVKFRMGDEEGARADSEDIRAEADIQEMVFRLGFNAKKEPFRFGFYAKKEALRLGYYARYLTSVRYWCSFYQDRGVLKRWLGNFCGALEDLDRSLRLRPNDYEALKQRGYVKFLMGDEEGARADAKEALRFRPCRVDQIGYENRCLCTSIVNFLNFQL